MSEKQFVHAWYTGIYIAAGIVTAVAALLLTIIGTARAILHNAQRILELANAIVANTRPIWDLEQTNEVAAQLSQGVQDIAGHAADIADALGETHAS